MAQLPDQSAVVEDRVIRKVTVRLVPFLGLLYVVNYLDRVNISFAALRMNADLGLSAAAYGLGAGLFVGLVRDLDEHFVEVPLVPGACPMPMQGARKLSGTR